VMRKDFFDVDSFMIQRRRGCGDPKVAQNSGSVPLRSILGMAARERESALSIRV
jgi:hypothetical protein